MSNDKTAQLKELYKAEDAAAREYLELRDAKSNGCCHGKSMMEVLEYDALIMKAYQKLQAAQQVVVQYIEEVTR